MANPQKQSRPRKRPRGRTGITNHPLDEEIDQLKRVPPSGSARGETEPALRPRPDEHPAPRDPAPKRRRAKYPMPE